MLPAIDSPLVDAVPSADCILSTDQRGESRPADGNDDGDATACDIGAVERQPSDIEAEPAADAESEPDRTVGPVAARPGFTG